jgi:proteasome activator subunit 4
MSLLSGTVSHSTHSACHHSERFTVPTNNEINFVLDIIDQIGQPALQMVETLIANNAKWNNVSQNDFCRYYYYYYSN